MQNFQFSRNSERSNTDIHQKKHLIRYLFSQETIILRLI